MSDKTTPIDKVRAALEYAAHEATNDYWREQYKKTLSELDGMVLVPVKPTIAQMQSGQLVIDVSAEAFEDQSDAQYKARDVYLRMIAPYVKGE